MDIKIIGEFLFSKPRSKFFEEIYNINTYKLQMILFMYVKLC